MTKNVCIIHYNTPTLTERLVESINKCTPDTKIYIFDNSDKKPFKKEYDNVTIFDNTKKQYIDFDKWLKKYPNRNLSGGKANKWGSAKHAYSVEKCMELIKEPFVLLDSDVLIKRDFSILYCDDVCYVGEVANQHKSKIKRVLPFICFINTPLCVKKKVHYFDEKYMHGLRVGSTGDSYDTGAALYLLTEKAKAKHKEIKVENFVVHYGSGSWVIAQEKMRRKTHIAENVWLKKHENLWKMEEEKINTENSFETVFDHIYCLHNLPDASRLPELKKELRRVGIDETAPYFSWKYDFPSPILDCMFDDKRLKMDISLRASSRNYIKRVSLRHYEIIKEAYAIGYERILILENDIRFHNDLKYVEKMLENIPDGDIIMFDKMTCSAPSEPIKYKQYIKSLPEGALYGNMNDSGVFFIFCSCYALNRTGMKRVIDTQEMNLFPPDTPLNDKSINGMFAVTNLAIQDPKLKTRKNETYDKIGLDVNNYGKNDEPLIVEKEFEEALEPENIVSKPSKPKIIREPEKKVTTKLREAINKKKVNAVVFRVPTRPQTKKKLEPAPTLKAPVQKPLPKSTGPLITKRAILLDKKLAHTRVISGKSGGFNKLYEQ